MRDAEIIRIKKDIDRGETALMDMMNETDPYIQRPMLMRITILKWNRF